MRRVLPQRRAAETFNLRFWNQPFTVTVGFYADGTPGEVFIDGGKTGQDIAEHSPRRRRGAEPRTAARHAHRDDPARSHAQRLRRGCLDPGGCCRSPANDFKIPRSKMSIGPHRQRLDDAGRDALREVAPDIIAEFRGPHNRRLSTRKEMRWGNNGSFALLIAGPREGLWFDHELGRGGDIIEFIRLERGCSFVEALDFAAQFTPELRRHVCRRDGPPTATTTTTTRSASSRRSPSGPRPSHCAERWPKPICARATSSRCQIEALEALRFHPACPWQGERRPALIALVRDVITDEPTGIHRTALTAAGAKLGRKMLGLKADGAIKLAVATTELAIAEGVETALSATILGFGPAWSMIDAGELGKFPVLPWIERLTIIVDNDIGGAGQRAAAQRGRGGRRRDCGSAP